MREHADELDWAAAWFRTLWRIGFGLSILFAIGTILILLFGRFDPNLGLNSATIKFLNVANGIGLTIGLLLTAFLFRVAFIICSFLADFARGLLSQQIRRERQNQQP